MEKYLQAKVKHHHVWDHYIRRWSDNGRDVWHTTSSKKIAYDSAKGLAREDNFYRVMPLNNDHVECIRGLSAMSPQGLQDLHISFLENILKLQRAENLYVQSGRKSEELEKHLHAMRCNLLENIHTSIEGQTRNILDELTKRNFSILNEPENMMRFCYFFGHQISRTKNFKDNLFSSGKIVEYNGMLKVMEECWWFLSYMFGINIGSSVFLNRKNEHHYLLINDTSMPFITSDQPIVNAYQFLTDKVKPPMHHECDFYYPISPTIAYMVSNSARFTSSEVHVKLNFVEEMNIKMAKRANIHLFGSTKESLRPFIKYIATHKENCEALFANENIGHN